jgi:hypothetical protein
MNKTTTTRKLSEKRILDSESPKLDKNFFSTAIAVRPDTLLAR